MEIRGPLAVALARGGRLVAFVGVIDADGLLETKDDCVRAARAFAERRSRTFRREDLPGH